MDQFDLISMFPFFINSFKLAIEAITTINALLHGEQIVQMVVPLQNMSRRLILN